MLVIIVTFRFLFDFILFCRLWISSWKMQENARKKGGKCWERKNWTGLTHNQPKNRIKKRTGPKAKQTGLRASEPVQPFFPLMCRARNLTNTPLNSHSLSLPQSYSLSSFRLPWNSPRETRDLPIFPASILISPHFLSLWSSSLSLRLTITTPPSSIFNHVACQHTTFIHYPRTLQIEG